MGSAEEQPKSNITPVQAGCFQPFVLWFRSPLILVSGLCVFKTASLENDKKTYTKNHASKTPSHNTAIPVYTGLYYQILSRNNQLNLMLSINLLINKVCLYRVL